MRASRVGATLFELLIWLSLLGVLASLALPSMQRGLDALAVRAARETGFAMLSRARVIALHEGGAEIYLDANADRMRVRSPSGAVHDEHLFAVNHIDLVLDGQSQAVILRYDAHGIGRMSSRTIRFRAGRAEAGLTISAYGRVRRW